MTTQFAYIEKAKARLNQWDAQISYASATLQELKSDAKIARKEQLDAMRKKRNEAKQKLDEAQAASEEAWSELETSATKAWDHLEEGFKKATLKLH